jgi:hypothetical protein
MKLSQKKSFSPISALDARFMSSKYQRIPADAPTVKNSSDGKSSEAGKIASALIWNQNPNFEISFYYFSNPIL